MDEEEQAVNRSGEQKTKKKNERKIMVVQQRFCSKPDNYLREVGSWCPLPFGGGPGDCSNFPAAFWAFASL